MGNCCGKESGGNFSGEGHTVGGSQAQTTPQAPRPVQAQAISPANSKAPPRVGGPGHTLGSAGTEEDARTAAAKAAEARANKSQGSGPLAAKLAAQRKAGMQGALKDAANENRRAREADAVAETRQYN
ncbi:gb [Venturia nashicola]|uniref:Gb n=1 Tax=Venturia nashicola TaxID=86259 RepID=A0A4Z1PFG4_9PEZI|nr:gb [Venturia nashicola]TLD34758.1 gb [Venturia nashicola]